MTTEDKGKVDSFDKSDLMGVKPFGNIGPGRSTEETKKVVEKLKKRKANGGEEGDGDIADGSTEESGEKANAVSSALSGFANRR